MPPTTGEDETPGAGDAAPCSIDAIARALAARPRSDGNGSLEWIQTHISHVFLDADRVYKLRKAVTLPFLDFGTRAKRNADCLDETRLNRRLAPDVYLGVAPVLASDEGVRLGSLSDSIDDPSREHAVVMRRLPAGRDLLALLATGRVPEHAIPAIAERLAGFHAEYRLTPQDTGDRDDWLDHCTRPAFECLPILRESELVEAHRLDVLETRLRARFAALAPHLEARRREGLPIEGHGDLHLDHVWFETDASPPLMIDCLEFDPDLRRIDPASELGFLTMDLHYRDAPALAEWLLASYATESDDYGLFRAVDVFAAYRGLVRSKVAALAVAQRGIASVQRERARTSTLAHLDVADALLNPRAAGGVILLCGTVGTGKSTVARTRARAGEGVPIVSDRVRKLQAGLGPTDTAAAAPDEGLYRPEAREAAYRGLLERAEHVVAGGRTALLDASFTRRGDRDRVRRWAEARGIRPLLIEVRCAKETARARLERRQQEGRDPSDAGPEFLETSLARFEPPTEWPDPDREVVWTDRSSSPGSGGA